MLSGRSTTAMIGRSTRMGSAPAQLISPVTTRVFVARTQPAKAELVRPDIVAVGLEADDEVRARVNRRKARDLHRVENAKDI